MSSRDRPTTALRPATDGREWHEAARAARYLNQVTGLPWWGESERALVEQLPARVSRFLTSAPGTAA